MANSSMPIGPFALHISTSQYQQETQGQMFSECMVALLPEQPGRIGGGMLIKKRELRSDEHDQPARIEPQEKQDQDGKAGIDGAVLGRLGHKCRKRLPRDAPEDGRGDPADQRRVESHRVCEG